MATPASVPKEALSPVVQQNTLIPSSSSSSSSTRLYATVRSHDSPPRSKPKPNSNPKPTSTKKAAQPRPNITIHSHVHHIAERDVRHTIVNCAPVPPVPVSVTLTDRPKVRIPIIPTQPMSNPLGRRDMAEERMEGMKPTFLQLLLHPSTHPSLANIKSISQQRAIEHRQMEDAKRIYGANWSTWGKATATASLPSSSSSPSPSSSTASLYSSSLLPDASTLSMSLRAAAFSHPDIQVRLLLFWLLLDSNRRVDGLLTFDGYSIFYHCLASCLLGGDYGSDAVSESCRGDWSRDWGGVYPGASTEFSSQQGLPLHAFMQSIFEIIDIFMVEPIIESLPLGPTGVRVRLPNYANYIEAIEKIFVTITQRTIVSTKELKSEEKDGVATSQPQDRYIFSLRSVDEIASTVLSNSASHSSSTIESNHQYTNSAIWSMLQHPESDFQRSLRNEIDPSTQLPSPSPSSSSLSTADVIESVSPSTIANATQPVSSSPPSNLPPLIDSADESILTSVNAVDKVGSHSIVTVPNPIPLSVIDVAPTSPKTDSSQKNLPQSPTHTTAQCSQSKTSDRGIVSSTLHKWSGSVHPPPSHSDSNSASHTDSPHSRPHHPRRLHTFSQFHLESHHQYVYDLAMSRAAQEADNDHLIDECRSIVHRSHLADWRRGLPKLSQIRFGSNKSQHIESSNSNKSLKVDQKSVSNDVDTHDPTQLFQHMTLPPDFEVRPPQSSNHHNVKHEMSSHSSHSNEASQRAFTLPTIANDAVAVSMHEPTSQLSLDSAIVPSDVGSNVDANCILGATRASSSMSLSTSTSREIHIASTHSIMLNEDSALLKKTPHADPIESHPSLNRSSSNSSSNSTLSSRSANSCSSHSSLSSAPVDDDGDGCDRDSLTASDSTSHSRASASVDEPTHSFDSDQSLHDYLRQHQQQLAVQAIERQTIMAQMHQHQHQHGHEENDGNDEKEQHVDEGIDANSTDSHHGVPSISLSSSNPASASSPVSDGSLDDSPSRSIVDVRVPPRSWAEFEFALANARTPMEVKALQRQMLRLKQFTHQGRGFINESNTMLLKGSPSDSSVLTFNRRHHPNMFTSTFALPSRRLIDRMRPITMPTNPKKPLVISPRQPVSQQSQSSHTTHSHDSHVDASNESVQRIGGDSIRAAGHLVGASSLPSKTSKRLTLPSLTSTSPRHHSLLSRSQTVFGWTSPRNARHHLLMNTHESRVSSLTPSSPRATLTARTQPNLSSSLARPNREKVDWTRIQSTHTPIHAIAKKRGGPIVPILPTSPGTGVSPRVHPTSLLDEDIMRFRHESDPSFAASLTSPSNLNLPLWSRPSLDPPQVQARDELYMNQLSTFFARHGGSVHEPFDPLAIVSLDHLFVDPSHGTLARHIDIGASARREKLGKARQFQPRNTNIAQQANETIYQQLAERERQVREAVNRGEIIHIANSNHSTNLAGPITIDDTHRPNGDRSEIDGTNYELIRPSSSSTLSASTDYSYAHHSITGGSIFGGSDHNSDKDHFLLHHSYDSNSKSADWRHLSPSRLLSSSPSRSPSHSSSNRSPLAGRRILAAAVAAAEAKSSEN